MWAPEAFGPRITGVGARFVDLFAGRPLESVDASSMPRSRRYIAFAAAFLDDLVREVGAVGPRWSSTTRTPSWRRSWRHGSGSPPSTSAPATRAARLGIATALGRAPVEITSDECTQALATLREKYGFESLDEYAYYAVSPDLNIYCEPPQFLLPEHRPLFEPVAFFGSVPSAGDPRRRGGRPAFVTERRKAYVSFGTIIWRYYQRRGSRRARHALGGAFAIGHRDRHQPGRARGRLCSLGGTSSGPASASRAMSTSGPYSPMPTCSSPTTGSTRRTRRSFRRCRCSRTPSSATNPTWPRAARIWVWRSR